MLRVSCIIKSDIFVNLGIKYINVTELIFYPVPIVLINQAIYHRITGGTKLKFTGVEENNAQRGFSKSWID